MRRRKIGTGVTRHEQIVWGGEDEKTRTDVLRELGIDGYIDPKSDFIGWLDRREAQLAKMLEHFKLPAPNRIVAFDNSNPLDWQYDDEIGSRRTEWYLQTFPYQSSFWYIGRVLFHIVQCRHAIRNERWPELAGRAIELGDVDREFLLKFSAEKRIRDFERHVAGSNRGNATRQARAIEWQLVAQRIVQTHPDIDIHNASAAAQSVLNAWPHGSERPSARALRRYLPELAKRYVWPKN